MIKLAWQELIGMLGRFRGAYRWIVAVVAVIFLSLAVAVSPALLMLGTHFKGIDWARLSNIGQTYGAASAVISTLALLAVAVSLITQAHQVRLGQLQAARSFQLDLMRMAMKDPAITPLWLYAQVGGQDDARKSMFLQLTFKYFEMLYIMRLVDAGSLDRTMRYRFQDQEVRDFWVRTGNVYHEEASNRMQARYPRIVDSALKSALAQPRQSRTPSVQTVRRAAGEAGAFPVKKRKSNPLSGARRDGLMLGAGIAAGVAVWGIARGQREAWRRRS